MLQQRAGIAAAILICGRAGEDAWRGQIKPRGSRSLGA